jgi:hypothetical protein
MHVHRCCSDRALTDKRDTLKVSQSGYPGTIPYEHKNRFLQTSLPMSQHLGNVRQIRTIVQRVGGHKMLQKC